MLGHLHRGSGFAIGTSIFGRALPSIFLIAVFLTVLGLGFTNNMVALAVLAIGPILTNAYLGVEGVDRDAVEAARGMGISGARRSSRGSSSRSRCRSSTSGIRVAAVTVVATAPIAAVRRRRRARRHHRQPGDLPLSGVARGLALRDGALGGSMGSRFCVTESC